MILRLLLVQTVISSLIGDISTENVQIFDQTKWCNNKIFIGTRYSAGVLKYTSYSSRADCNYTIETSFGYRLAYALQTFEERPAHLCSSKLDIYEGAKVLPFCAISYSLQTFITTQNSISLQARFGRESSEFRFVLLFLSYHDKECLTSEWRCRGLLSDTNSFSGCVDNSIVCHSTYKFCANFDCFDIPADSSNSSTVLAVVIPIAIVVCLIGAAFAICFKKRWICFAKSRSSESEMRQRIVGVFAVQYARRDVDGSENLAYTDDQGRPVDIHMFDPPPEYGSWEHLDQADRPSVQANGHTDCINSHQEYANTSCGQRDESESGLPSYGDVMQKFDDYNIITQI